MIFWRIVDNKFYQVKLIFHKNGLANLFLINVEIF